MEIQEIVTVLTGHEIKTLSDLVAVRGIRDDEEVTIEQRHAPQWTISRAKFGAERIHLGPAQDEPKWLAGGRS